MARSSSSRAWRACSRRRKTTGGWAAATKGRRIIFINKLDRTGADFFRAFATLKEKLDIVALPLQLPVGVEDQFLGVVDLVEMKAIIWEGGELGAKYHYEDIPADMAELVATHRQTLLDTALSVDEKAMEEYFDKGDVSIETMKRCIKR